MARTNGNDKGLTTFGKAAVSGLGVGPVRGGAGKDVLPGPGSRPTGTGFGPGPARGIIGVTKQAGSAPVGPINVAARHLSGAIGLLRAEVRRPSSLGAMALAMPGSTAGRVRPADPFASAGSGLNCFASGTRIKTRGGEVPVEQLLVGQDVLTLDDGFMPVRWIGARRVGAEELTAVPALRPIRIAAGALGENQPEQDLLVSPQHRVLVRSRVAERMFGAREVLMAAKHLLGLDGVAVAEDLAEVTYWHFLFDQHQVVFSNGAPTESLFTGPEALKSVTPEAREEILALFPELADGVPGLPARMLVPGRPARRFAERVKRNGKALVA